MLKKLQSQFQLPLRNAPLRMEVPIRGLGSKADFNATHLPCDVDCASHFSLLNKFTLHICVMYRFVHVEARHYLRLTYLACIGAKGGRCDGQQTTGRGTGLDRPGQSTVLACCAFPKRHSATSSKDMGNRACRRHRSHVRSHVEALSVSPVLPQPGPDAVGLWRPTSANSNSVLIALLCSNCAPEALRWLTICAASTAYLCRRLGGLPRLQEEWMGPRRARRLRDRGAACHLWARPRAPKSDTGVGERGVGRDYTLDCV
jgi:hypothetical protein